MDERYVASGDSGRAMLTRDHIAAYQVGLSYLSTGMRRAVAACTSPEVFFGSTAIPQPISNQTYSNVTTDPLNLAMETLNLSDPATSPTSPSY